MTHQTVSVENQTAQHIINHCTVLGPPKEVDLAHPKDATSHWLKQLEGVT